MIVDTSALVAIVKSEPQWETLFEAIFNGSGIIPAPVIVEFHRVTGLDDNEFDPVAKGLIEDMQAGQFKVYPFDEAAAHIAASANATYGSGNGKGSRLNMLDLMVYGTAKALDMPILCTGKDFAATDADLHAASRPD